VPCRPQSSCAHACSAALENIRCQLFWEQDRLLYIGWGDSVKVGLASQPEVWIILTQKFEIGNRSLCLSG